MQRSPNPQLRSDKPLWTPLMIGRMSVGGRLFKSATSETRATLDGFVTDEVISFYEPMARAGTPLIVTGNMFVSWQGHSAGRQMGIDHDDKLPGLRRLNAAVRENGKGKVRLIAQLNHGGRQTVRPNAGNNLVVSASAVFEPVLGTAPRSLTREELWAVVDSFASAAVRAREAGFDGIQVHAAHGYLLSQFLTPHTNRRTDDYGGNLGNRMRLLLEVVREIRIRVGMDYPLLVKLNGTDSLWPRRGTSTQEFILVAVALEQAGVDALEISRCHYESLPGMLSGQYKGFVRTQISDGSGREFSPLRKRLGWWLGPSIDWFNELIAPRGEGYNLPQAQLIKEALRIPVITVGGFVTREAMEASLLENRTDAVSCARALIADPYLFQHLYQPDPLAPVCKFCNQCIARLGAHPVDCYSERIGQRRREMLARTSQWIF